MVGVRTARVRWSDDSSGSCSISSSGGGGGGGSCGGGGSSSGRWEVVVSMLPVKSDRYGASTTVATITSASTRRHGHTGLLDRGFGPDNKNKYLVKFMDDKNRSRAVNKIYMSYTWNKRPSCEQTLHFSHHTFVAGKEEKEKKTQKE
ncbi:hypothetical protein M0802_003047 [Mischocyttarus mexicanus]|nr:hypothetical protein M0802_003047 [Mischocyttarus mexicanus]